MDDKTIKEICDVVTEEVVKQVQSNLSAMKPQIIEEIKQSVIQETKRMIDSRLDENDNRIAQIEYRIAGLANKSHESQQPIVENNLTTVVDGINTLSPSQIEEILSFSELSVEKRGWIYYIKPIDQFDGELYKVKIDGSNNQKIFKGKVRTFILELKSDSLHFLDSELNDRVIKLK